ncbi:type II CAAX endopeptidase family protein [Micromonospora sp. NPDC002296]|uniref:CPBP family intramembrane glutamic endopeptidase n=1 Tax=Micromonospora sp. NPDC002296 TaxID=3154271 RepID=UPI0033216979
MTVVKQPQLARPVRQYSKAVVLAVWAAAAVPMGLLAWVVAPAIAGPSAQDFAIALVGALTVGLVWQFLLVAGLVAHEQGTLRWSVVREALWLGRPTDPKTGRRGGRLWWWALVAVIAVAATEALPIPLTEPVRRSFGAFLGTEEGQDAFRGNWGLFALIVTMFLFNTVLGEELLFRGVLLPRMEAAFGNSSWLVNAVLFGLYHLHQPWSIPDAVAGGLVMAWTSRRWQTALFGIISHSAQSVVFTVVLLALVLS